MSTAEAPFTIRSVGLAVFLPTLLFSLGEGAILPMIPLVATALGANLAVAGLIAAMVTAGTLIGDLPSGWIVAKVGERPAMIAAAAVAVVGLLLAIAATTPVLLGIGILLVGLATAVFALARHAFLTSFVPVHIRARSLSTLGGTFRLGSFFGPFLSAAVISLTGSVQAVFWVHVAACVLTVLILLFLQDPSSRFVNGTARAHGGARGRPSAPQRAGLAATIVSNRAVLARLGSGAALVGGMRAGRVVILPLWAVSIGIPEANLALIIGVAGAVDFALFYASGQVMDRFGRLWSALPSMIGLAGGYLVLAATHDVPNRVAWFLAAVALMALANGIGSGILMTLGADLADRHNPAPFLGAWRFTADAGSAAAPLTISLVTAVATLAAASAAMGALGMLGAAILLRYVPRYAPRLRDGPAVPDTGPAHPGTRP